MWWLHGGSKTWAGLTDEAEVFTLLHQSNHAWGSLPDRQFMDAMCPTYATAQDINRNHSHPQKLRCYGYHCLHLRVHSRIRNAQLWLLIYVLSKASPTCSALISTEMSVVTHTHSKQTSLLWNPPKSSQSHSLCIGYCAIHHELTPINIAASLVRFIDTTNPFMYLSWKLFQ